MANMAMLVAQSVPLSPQTVEVRGKLRWSLMNSLFPRLSDHVLKELAQAVQILKGYDLQLFGFWDLMLNGEELSWLSEKELG